MVSVICRAPARPLRNAAQHLGRRGVGGREPVLDAGLQAGPPPAIAERLRLLAEGLAQLGRLGQQGAAVARLHALEEREVVEGQLDLVGVQQVEHHHVVAAGARLAQPFGHRAAGPAAPSSPRPPRAPCTASARRPAGRRRSSPGCACPPARPGGRSARRRRCCPPGRRRRAAGRSRAPGPTGCWAAGSAGSGRRTGTGRPDRPACPAGRPARPPGSRRRSAWRRPRARSPSRPRRRPPGRCASRSRPRTA